MFCVFKLRYLICAFLCFCGAAVLAVFGFLTYTSRYATVMSEGQQKKYIKWVDFNVSYAALVDSMELDINSHNQQNGNVFDWIEVLAYLSAKNGGNYSKYNKKQIDDLVEKVDKGESIDVLAHGLKHYDYYKEAYTAILGEYLGNYQIETPDENGNLVWKEKYGLKVFSPIAEGFQYNSYDDFGDGRSYGYKRKHLGHDYMAETGTPIIAVESGVVEELGWNQYGGWRIGIRSFDQKRYYYYAHMRKDNPYVEGLEKGQTVNSGDVLGYVGRTGYSTVENTNNIKQSHLHFGLQLIFDESQKEGSTEIWINFNNLSRLLEKNRATVRKESGSKDYKRAYRFRESQDSVESMETDEDNKVTVPIIMYHSILKNGKKSAYVITPQMFKDDLQYLAANGYTTVVMQDLIDFVEGKKPLPQRPIVLTFDDGHYNNVYYAKPLLEEFNMKAVISVVGCFSEEYSKIGKRNPNFSYITWEDMAELIKGDTIEIQNHSYALHDTNLAPGVRRKQGESDENYKNRISEDIEKMQEMIYQNSNYLPTTFTYPFGIVNSQSDSILKEIGFAATLGCESGVNTVVKGYPDTLYRMKRLLRSNKKSVESHLLALEQKSKQETDKVKK